MFNYDTSCDTPPPVPNGVWDSAFGSTLFPDTGSSSGGSRRLEAVADGEQPAYMEKPEDAFMF